MLQIIPAVDVLDGAVVRLVHGDFERITVYDADPVARARQWMDEGAELVHVVDLEGARTGTPSVDLWERLAGEGIRFQVGGGIRTAALAEQALTAGADRVVLGTAAVWDPAVLGAISDPTRVVAAVDVRDGRATGAGWLDEGRDTVDVLEDLARHGVDRLLVTGISSDGTMQGPELELLGSAVSDGRFRVIASGGVGSLHDLRQIASLGCDGVVIGRALYESRFTLSEAISAVS